MEDVKNKKEAQDDNMKALMADSIINDSPLLQYIGHDVKTKDKEDFSFSLNESLDKTRQNVQKLVEDGCKDSTTTTPIKTSINDAFGNTLNATGTADKVKTFNSYGFSNDTLNFMLWYALYNDSWTFKIAIDKPAEDMISCGIKLNVKSKEAEIMTELDKHANERTNLLKWGALVGGAVAVIMLKGVKPKDMKNPLNFKKIDKDTTIRLYVTDRWYGVAIHGNEVVEDMDDVDYGKPKFYDITFADGKTFVVHHSRVIRYEHRQAPNLIKVGYLQGWGYAEGCHILNELSRDDQIKAAITSLINKSLIEVIKMSGMRGVFNGAIDKAGEAQLAKRLEMVNWGRTFNSLTFLDKDDDYQTSQFSVGGLADILNTNFRLVAAAEQMSGILYGDIDGGFSADSVAMERYDNVIHGRNEALNRSCTYKLLKVIYAKYGVTEEVDFEFNSLLMKKQDEDRLEALGRFRDVVSGMLSDGMIPLHKATKAVQNFTQNGTIDFDISEEDIKQIEKEEKEQYEDIDLDEDIEVKGKKKK